MIRLLFRTSYPDVRQTLEVREEAPSPSLDAILSTPALRGALLGLGEIGVLGIEAAAGKGDAGGAADGGIGLAGMEPGGKGVPGIYLLLL